MCDPVSLIGGALSIGASVMQAQAQMQYQAEVNRQNRIAYENSKKAREAEMARQDAFEKQAADQWGATVDALSADSQATAQDAAVEDFKGNMDDLPSTLQEGQLLSGQEYANDTIKTEIATRANAAAADARRRIEALAKLSSANTVAAQRNTSLGDNANFLTTLNGLRRGSLTVSGQEQNIAPAQVTMGSTALADIMSGAGGIVSSYGGGTRSPSSPAVSASIAAGQGGLY